MGLIDVICVSQESYLMQDPIRPGKLLLNKRNELIFKWRHTKKKHLSSSMK